MTVTQHKLVTTADNHPVLGLGPYSSAANRRAATLTSADVGKIALQTDTSPPTMWSVLSVSGGAGTWSRIDTGAEVTSFNFASLITSPYFCFQSDIGYNAGTGAWADQSGNSHNGAYDTHGTAPTVGTGLNGRASVVVGASSGILFPTTLPAPGTTSFSVLLVVKATSWSSGALLFAGADAASALIKQAGVTPQIAQAVTAQTQSGNLTLGSFYMVVATFTNSASDSLRIGSASAATGSNSGNASGEATYALGYSFNRGPGFAGEILLATAYPGTTEPTGLRAQALSYWPGLNA